MHISPYEHGNIFNKNPLRDRKLLLHKKEINLFSNLIKYKALPIVIYNINNWERKTQNTVI